MFLFVYNKLSYSYSPQYPDHSETDSFGMNECLTTP